MIGVLLVVLAVLSLPEVRFLTKHLRESLNTLCSLTLALVGIVWLVAVECFLRFFDQFLSRN
jgi:predicted PurR-regulated permease PerM